MREVRIVFSRIAAVCVGFVLPFAMSGCGGGSGAGSGTTINNPTVPSTSVPAVILSSANIDFGEVTVGASVSRTVTLNNTGQATLTITSINASGDFAEVSNCGTAVGASSACTITVRFTPTSLAARSGTLTISDNADGSPHRVTLVGRGVSAPAPALTITPTALSFGAQTLSTISSGQTVKLSNTGTALLDISNIALTGDYAQTNDCGATLSVGASCTVSVSFTPTAVGARTGTLSIVDDASGSPHSVSLNGTGVNTGELSVTPTSVSFGDVVVGSTSAKTVKVSNTGTRALTIASASTSGPGFSISGLSASSILPAGQAVTFSVNFAPSSGGSATGSVLLRVSETSSEMVVPLSGRGLAAVQHSVSLWWTASESSVDGYNVYRSVQMGGPYTRLNSAVVTGVSFTDTSVSSGQTYWYVLTSVGSGNIESGYSSAIQVAIPGP